MKTDEVLSLSGQPSILPLPSFLHLARKAFRLSVGAAIR
jgi:hypothetical protein